jgi:hypothetical protein
MKAKIRWKYSSDGVNEKILQNSGDKPVGKSHLEDLEEDNKLIMGMEDITGIRYF